MTRLLPLLVPMLVGTLLVAAWTPASSAQTTTGAQTTPTAQVGSGKVLVVASEGPYRTIAEALSQATVGATIEVRGGRHAGPLVVDRRVTLLGVDMPSIDGGGHGTVVTITAAGSVLRGFDIRGSGSDLNTEDAGVQVRAADVTIEQNRLHDVLVGIALDDAPRGVVRHNQIAGKTTLPSPSRGDGLRLWYSSDALVEGNRVTATRDCVIWYSSGLRLLGNTIEQGRYGLHFMYDDNAVIDGNVLRDNSVGAYLMYSRNVTLRGNLVASNRGPSGFGLGLKDVDDVVLRHNWVVDNRVGIYVDNSPTSLTATSQYERNVIALNDIGLTFLPSVQRNAFRDNIFRDNGQQVSVQGGGALRANSWTSGGRGNYWGDYGGFDAAGDGIGDTPYRAEGLVGHLIDRHPELRLFQFGLVSQAVEFAARAFPTLRPAPKLVDDAPLMEPPTVPAPPVDAAAGAGRMLGVALGLLGLAGGLLALGRARPGGRRAVAPARPAGPALMVSGLSKRFGRQVAVAGLSFSVAPGEVVALWGQNGAGKTTAIKCILGLLPCAGQVTVAGLDALRHGRTARRALGYVPQEVALHDDLGVRETAIFYGRLRGASSTRADECLAQLGLLPHARKSVGALSGGLRQRLALAIALLGDPQVLLLDEPTANLDAAGRALLVTVLADLRRRGTAVALTSHRLEEVEALADRVLVLEQGRLAFECPPVELAVRLGLRLTVKLRVADTTRARAMVVLTEAGLDPHANGRGLGVTVPLADKARPIRLLEQAGIPVLDFVLENGGHDATGEATP